MKWILRILFLPIMVVNLVSALLLIGCAYSPFLPPATLPLLSLAGLAFPFVLAGNVAFIIAWLLVRRRNAWLSVIACLICLPQMRAFVPINIGNQKTPSDAIKLVSYNILSSNLTASTANRDNPLITYLEGCGADIICLQEFPFVSLKNSAKGKKLLADYPYRSYNLSKESELEARFLCCLSKHPILSVETIDIGSTSNGCAKYRILHGTDTIVVYNCHLESNHLDSNNKSTYEQLLTKPKKENIKVDETKVLVKKLRDASAKRAEQADIILADLRQETTPYIIVCGDFNDSPISYTRRKLTNELDDAFVGSGNGPGISYNRNKMYYRIDHILHSSSFDSYACKVDHTVKVSDHYPISCYLEKN